MEFSDKAVVLHVGRFKEADIWVRVLSPSRGVFSAFAFGGSRSKRRFIGCLDVFNQVLFKVQSTHHGDYLCLQEGVLLQGPQLLRSDASRFGMAMNCGKFLQAFGVTEEGAIQVYALFVELLRIFEEPCTLSPLLPVFFRVRLAFIQGYALELYTCGGCGASLEDGVAYFHVRSGQVVCSGCAKLRTDYMLRLGQTTRRALAVVTAGTVEDWLHMTLDGNDRHEFSRAADAFIQFHVGLVWENGRFFRV